MTTRTAVKELISYPDTNSFTPIALDLHSGKKELERFAGNFFSIEKLGRQIEIRSQKQVDRSLLHSVITEQYQGIKLTAAVKANLDSLLDDNTFTVVTGHQLCLFTGPLYFIYKIVHTLNLAKAATALNPGKKIVPVFWMATEDHDFAEVASAKVNGTKFQWDTHSANRPVGRLKLETITEVLSTLRHNLGDGPRANEIMALLEKVYQPGSDLATATRTLVNELFGKFGLVIIDGDHKALKSEFAPIVRKEILVQLSYQAVGEQTNELGKHYKIQVNPRECNFFLFEKGVRRRIDRVGNGFVLADTEVIFSQQELLNRLDSAPEDFSPNVIMRPVYQEVLLPNLAYIGGGGELAYWLQLRSMFDKLAVPFPLLVLRNSVQLIEADEKALMDKLNIDTKTLFQSKESLYKLLISELESEQFYSLAEELKASLQNTELLASKAGEKDPTLRAHVEAEGKRQEKFIQHLEKKLYRVAKHKHESTLRKLDILLEALLPGGGLQERKENIFTYIYRHGFGVIDLLVEELDPANEKFTVLYL